MSSENNRYGGTKSQQYSTSTAVWGNFGGGGTLIKSHQIGELGAAGLCSYVSLLTISMFFFLIKMNQQQNDTNSPLKIRKYTVESEEACFFHPLTNIYSDNESVRKYYQ